MVSNDDPEMVSNDDPENTDLHVENVECIINTVSNVVPENNDTQPKPNKYTECCINTVVNAANMVENIVASNVQCQRISRSKHRTFSLAQLTRNN